MDNERNYTVYKHTSPSGKVYIGITRLSPERRWLNGKGYKNNPYFTRAIELYGWDRIKHEIIAEGLTQRQAEDLEVELIKSYRSTDPEHGYNLDSGGTTGPKHSQATREKIGEANKKRVWTEEARAKVGASSRGRIPSKETREKMSAARSGSKNPNFGKKFSEEHRAKLSAARKSENWWARGRHLSEETKRKLAESKMKRVYCYETDTVYPSIKDAAKATGADASKVGAVCNKQRAHTKGFHFCFAVEEVV